MTKLVGKVYLIGAGPGDAKLITERGKECLQKGGCHFIRSPRQPAPAGICKQRLRICILRQIA
ncbi:hypothetical protein GCM10020331_072200 [Ectobacillus funiculus]